MAIRGLAAFGAAFMLFAFAFVPSIAVSQLA
jgi:hypothetical protein